MLLSGSGLVNATDSSSEKRNSSNGGIKVEDGKFVLNATPDEVNQDTYRLSKAAVDNFNAAIEAGHFHIGSPSTQIRPATQKTKQTSLRVSEGTTAADIAAVEDIESPDTLVSLDPTPKRENLNRIRPLHKVVTRMMWMLVDKHSRRRCMSTYT